MTQNVTPDAATPEAAATTSTRSSETLGFQAEVKQLLRLMIHSLYSHKEIFLRELISNAADACDKLRFEAIDHAELLEGDSELGIELNIDAAARTLTISDNGIGMNREEIVANLGTIARSGTRAFFERLTGDQQKDAQLIGQFGVGFYSAFIVAREVVVTSRRAGTPADQAVVWRSAGEGEFTVATTTRERRGTEIVLHFKEGEDDFLSGWQVREVVRKYSDHVAVPIRMHKEVWNDEAKRMKPQEELEVVNQASALWTRPKAEITDEQYTEFYKHLSHDFEPPLAWTHNRVEGRSDYTQLLYVPKRAPFDLWDRSLRRGLKLYVRRVFIMDDAEQLLPPYLRFVSGVIDSNDLPLNVSREILQESRDVKSIREGSAKRVLSLLEDLAANRAEDYQTFWNTFGQVLKEGVAEDETQRERLLKLLRFVSTAQSDDVATVSFDTYVSRMKPGQKNIYYVTADSLNTARKSPQLEVFLEKGIEVLLLTDRVDEWMLSFLTQFGEHSLVSVSKGGLDLNDITGESEKSEEAPENEAAQDQALIEKLQEALGDRVKSVRSTRRLVRSPACVVTDSADMSQHLLRMLKAAGQSAPATPPILEINLKHPLIKRVADADEDFSDLAHVLLDQALLAEGATLDDAPGFVARLNKLLAPASEQGSA